MSSQADRQWWKQQKGDLADLDAKTGTLPAEGLFETVVQKIRMTLVATRDNGNDVNPSTILKVLLLALPHTGESLYKKLLLNDISRTIFHYKVSNKSIKLEECPFTAPDNDPTTWYGKKLFYAHDGDPGCPQLLMPNWQFTKMEALHFKPCLTHLASVVLAAGITSFCEHDLLDGSRHSMLPPPTSHILRFGVFDNDSGYVSENPLLFRGFTKKEDVPDEEETQREKDSFWLAYVFGKEFQAQPWTWKKTKTFASYEQEDHVFFVQVHSSAHGVFQDLLLRDDSVSDHPGNCYVPDSTWAANVLEILTTVQVWDQVEPEDDFQDPISWMQTALNLTNVECTHAKTFLTANDVTKLLNWRFCPYQDNDAGKKVIKKFLYATWKHDIDTQKEYIYGEQFWIQVGDTPCVLALPGTLFDDFEWFKSRTSRNDCVVNIVHRANV